MRDGTLRRDLRQRRVIGDPPSLENKTTVVLIHPYRRRVVNWAAFLLGGKDNFAADRDQARKVLAVYPQAAELVIQARQFQARAIACAAQQCRVVKPARRMSTDPGNVFGVTARLS